MTFTLTINADSGAFFDESPNAEVARILRELATKLSAGYSDYGVIFDINGNRVGRWDWED